MTNMIKTKDAKKGGYLVGKPHSEGGIKGINVDTGEPIEVEGGEVVITKPAVDAQDKYNFEGKMMTPKEIMSELNSTYGGVSFKKGGEVARNKYDDGGLIQDLIDSGEVNERYKRRGFFTVSSGDDIHNGHYLKVDTIDLNENAVFDVTHNERELQRAIFEGDYILLKNNFYQSLSDFDIMNITEYPPNFWLPFQVKKITKDGTTVKSILLVRELNGVQQKVTIRDRWMSDSFIFIPNFMAELPNDFRDTEAYILPQNNNSGLSDNWLIGKPMLRYDAEDTSVNAAIYLYSYTNPLSHKTYTVGIDSGLTPKIICRDVVNSYNEAIEQKVANLAVSIGDVINANIKKDNISRIDNVRSDDLELFVYDKIEYPTNLNAPIKEIDGNNYYTLENCEIIGFKTKKPVGDLNTNYSYTDPYITDILFNYEGESYAVRRDSYCMEITEFVEFATNPNLSISDVEKKISRFRRKEQGENADLGFVAEILDSEITKLNVLRSLIDSSNLAKLNEIDKKVAELRQKRDLLLLKKEKPISLLDKLASINYSVKVEQDMPTSNLVSINGQPSVLTDKQWDRVRTENFISWFGNWIEAYKTNDYNGVSKAINEITKEPIVLYHGSKADFVRWRFNQFPAAYFADNRSYSEWFANIMGEGELYQVFVDMKNPIDMRSFGIERNTPREYLYYLLNNYDIPFEATAILKEYERGGQQAVDAFLDAPMYFWSFIRHHNQSLLIYLRDNTFYDGILMYENNPQDIIDGQENVTASYVVFRQEQIKWATAMYYNTIITDSRYEKGGLTKEEEELQKNIDLLKNANFVL